MSFKRQLLTAVISFFLASCGEGNTTAQADNEATGNITAVESAKPSSEAVKPAQQVSIDRNKLAGNWVRTDAPYNLKISGLADDGSINAEYFNPKSIHIGKATWSNTSGILNMYVELRDENYPGSNYTLFYYPDKDLLAGKYFQAVEGVTYDVGFIRTK